jgi:hypothetical protein
MYDFISSSDVHRHLDLGNDLGLIEDLNGLGTAEIIASTVLPNYKLSFLNADKSTMVNIANDTQSIMYNISYQFIEPPV